MNFENLINELKESGIEAEGITVCKNGCECTGIRVINPDCPNISPIIYYSTEETIESVLSRISSVMEHNPTTFDLECLNDPAYIMQNVYFSIQKTGSGNGEDLLKKNCLNLELVLRVAMSLGDSIGSIKIPRPLLGKNGLNENVLWKTAADNMRHRFIIMTMADMLGIPEEIIGKTPFYVCTTDSHTNGASVLAFPDIFHRFCAEKEMEKVYILPSSTEEVLICPADLVDSSSILADMVRDVNASCVDPLIQLEPVVYCYDYNSNKLTITAMSEGGRLDG